MADPAIAERSWPPASTARWAVAGARERSRPAAALVALSALTLVLLSWFLVLLTAAHPNFMAPTTATGYFPGWMSGPLGGLLGRSPPSEATMRTLVAVILVAMYLAYAAIGTVAGRAQARWVLGAVLATHLAFLLAPPLQYTDVFNYVNYGRMGVLHHLNPYATIPMLEPQRDPAFALSNWHWLLSPYGPLFTLFTYALVPLGVAGDFWAIKVVLCLASLGVLLLVWRCAGILGRDPVRAVALTGLNPIVLLWGLGADHNDVLMMLPLMLGVYLLVRARAGAGAERSARARAGSERLRSLGLRIGYEPLAAAAFVVAAGVKASAVVVIPVAFAAAPRKREFLAGLALAGLLLAAVSGAAFGAHLPGIGSQTELVTGVGPANLLGWALGQQGETETLRALLTLAAAAFVLAAAWRAWQAGRDWIALAGAGLAVVWVSTSWFSPWYIVWILPFAALARSGRLRLFVGLIGIYILLAFGPEQTRLLSALHFNPFGSQIGRQHSSENSRLVQ
jgi:hypothetical protein